MPSYAHTMRLRILAHARTHQATHYREVSWAAQAPDRTVAHLADPIALSARTRTDTELLLLEPTGAFALVRPADRSEMQRFMPAPVQPAVWEPVTGPARHGDAPLRHTGFLFEDRTWFTSCGGRVHRSQTRNPASCFHECGTCRVLDDVAAALATPGAVPVPGR